MQFTIKGFEIMNTFKIYRLKTLLTLDIFDRNM